MPETSGQLGYKLSLGGKMVNMYPDLRAHLPPETRWTGPLQIILRPPQLTLDAVPVWIEPSFASTAPPRGISIAKATAGHKLAQPIRSR